QLRLDVVVDDRKSAGLASRDRPGTVGGGARLGVAGDARRAHAVAARVEGDRRAGRLGAREGRRARTAARYTHGETGCRRRPAVVVDDVLDHDQLRLDVVVDDRARPGLARGDRAGAAGRGARLRVARHSPFAHAIAADGGRRLRRARLAPGEGRLAGPR